MLRQLPEGLPALSHSRPTMRLASFPTATWLWTERFSATCEWDCQPDFDSTQARRLGLWHLPDCPPSWPSHCAPGMCLEHPTSNARDRNAPAPARVSDWPATLAASPGCRGTLNEWP